MVSIIVTLIDIITGAIHIHVGIHIVVVAARYLIRMHILGECAITNINIHIVVVSLLLLLLLLLV